MAPLDRSPPSSRVATHLLACLLALAIASVVWQPVDDRDDGVTRWIDDVRTELREAQRAAASPRERAAALDEIRRRRIAELEELVAPELVAETARRVPLLGVDVATGDVHPVGPDGRPIE